MAKTTDTVRNIKTEMLFVAVLASLLAAFVLLMSNHMRVGHHALESPPAVTVGLYRGVLKELQIGTVAVLPTFALLQLFWAFTCIRWFRAIRSPDVDTGP